MTGLEILGAVVWIIINFIVLSWGGAVVFGGALIRVFSGRSSTVGSIWQFVGAILIAASIYSTCVWFTVIQNN